MHHHQLPTGTYEHLQIRQALLSFRDILLILDPHLILHTVNQKLEMKDRQKQACSIYLRLVGECDHLAKTAGMLETSLQGPL